MRWWVGVAMGVAVLAFGCGDDPSGPAAESTPDATGPAFQSAGEARTGKFTGRAAEVYDEARIVCGVKPARQVARDFGLDTANPTKVAERYARGYVSGLRQAAFEGCLKGLR